MSENFSSTVKSKLHSPKKKYGLTEETLMKLEEKPNLQSIIDCHNRIKYIKSKHFENAGAMDAIKKEMKGLKATLNALIKDQDMTSQKMMLNKFVTKKNEK